MGLKDKFKEAWSRVSDLDDESTGAREQASANERIPYKEISKGLKELMKKNVDVVGRKILIPSYYVVYFNSEDRDLRREVEDVLCDELKEELYPEMRKINPEQNKRELMIEISSDDQLERGKFRIEFRMKKPEGGAKPSPPPPQSSPPPADEDLQETVIERAPAPTPDADEQATVIQPAPSQLPYRLQISDGEQSREVTLTKDSITIGRASQDDVVLDSPDFSISRGHAQIRRDQGNFFITAVGVNGTLLNGEEMELKKEVPLSPEDEIKIVNYVLKLSV